MRVRVLRFGRKKRTLYNDPFFAATLADEPSPSSEELTLPVQVIQITKELGENVYDPELMDDYEGNVLGEWDSSSSLQCR